MGERIQDVLERLRKNRSIHPPKVERDGHHVKVGGGDRLKENFKSSGQSKNTQHSNMRLRGNIKVDGETVALIVKGKEDKVQQMENRANLYSEVAQHSNRSRSLLEDVLEDDNLHNAELRGRIKEFLENNPVSGEE